MEKHFFPEDISYTVFRKNVHATPPLNRYCCHQEVIIVHDVRVPVLCWMNPTAAASFYLILFSFV